MRKFVPLIILTILLAMGICSGRWRQQRVFQYESVSLVQLIANPDKYHNKKVRIIGVAHLEFEANGVYLTKEHCEKFIAKNGLWIDPDYDVLKTTANELSAHNGKYVLMEGVFDKNRTGHFGMWSGGLVKISRYDLHWRERANIGNTTQ